MRALVSVALVAAACGLSPDASAYCRSTTSRQRATALGECVRSGIPLGWRSRCTSFSLYRAGVPAEVTTAVLDRMARTATTAWARVPCDQDGLGRQYFQVLPVDQTWQLSGYNAQGQNANTVSFRHTWNDNAIHRPGAIAITIATFDSFTGEIFDADIELNTHDEATNRDGFRFSTAASVSDPGAADLQTILTHEFGHFMGLSHSDNDRAVMWPEAGLGEIRRDLTADDAAGMCAIYPEENTPNARCIPVPYGGLATQSGGTLVTQGECSATPRARTRALHLAPWFLAVFVALRRRERSATRAP